MNKPYAIISLFFMALVTMPAYAFETDKPIRATVSIQHDQQTKLVSQAKKDIVLEGLRLTPEEKKHLFRPMTSPKALINTLSLPEKVTLGMNGVPVLEQGQHGAAATFATTAAIDAVLGKGDYVSQLCYLEVSHFFSEHSYAHSSWLNASVGNELNQLAQFGIVSKQTQQSQSCAGLKEYPLDDGANEGNLMSLEEYKVKSENIPRNIQPELLLAPYHRLHHFTAQQADAVLAKVKQALANGHRLALKMLLLMIFDEANYCEAGACASFHKNKETWAYTKSLQAINDDTPLMIAAHALVITGYDDKATAIDHEGGVHQGLLILRNSWGQDAGDHGDYYMTYDYFKQFALEVYEIVG